MNIYWPNRMDIKKNTLNSDVSDFINKWHHFEKLPFTSERTK